ncbi:MAG: hypothetical protein J5669_05020 [Bacteroidales bacterium]|nr:hypothetical protein [Bacteroidales bacterium]
MSKQLHLTIWLVTLLALVSCQREKADINPTFDPTNNTVLAKFVFNVSTSNGPETKMTADAVQYDGTFRGMDKVHILAYNIDYGDHIWKPSQSPALKDFDLGTMIGSASGSDASRTVELALPLNTNVLALYGKAKKTPGADDAEGIVDLSWAPKTALSQTPDKILFKLQDRLQDTLAFNQFSTLVGAMLTGFFRTGLIHETEEDGFKADVNNTYSFWYPVDATSNTFPTRTDSTISKYGGSGEPLANNKVRVDNNVTYTFHTGTKTWREYGRQFARNKGYITEGSVVAMKPLEEVLGQAYAEFCTIKTKNQGTEKELRAGSSGALIRTISDLALVIDKVKTATPTGWEEEVAILLATELETRVLRYFEVPLNSDNSKNWAGLHFKTWKGENDPNDMSHMVDLYTPYTSATHFPKINEAFFADSTGFPINLNLPQGAAVLDVKTVTYNSKDYETFSYMKKIPAYGMGTTDYKMPIINYRFPPELMYYANSPIRVSTKNDNVTFPSTLIAWDSDQSWPSTIWSASGAHVESTTRSVAMVKHVNYGNALLQTKVKYQDGITGLHDNNSILHEGESDNVIPFTTGDALQITGIMIGGQPDFVGWNFIQVPDADLSAIYSGKTNPLDKLIYDKQLMPVSVPASGETGIMYTMCWDNYDASKADNEQGEVYVALELVNNTGRDFWGELNLIRKGGTFYLVGKLNPHSSTANEVTGIPSTLARSNYYYPPFNNDGNTINAPRVFMQDYATTATLVLGENSLRHAYVTVPDLRGSQVSLGLSVDLSWSAGLQFDNIVMGGN